MASNQYQLHLAIRRDDYDWVSAATTNLNEMDEEDRTPLFLAVELQNAKMVQLLLEKGADPEIPQYQTTYIIHLVAIAGSLELLEILLKHNIALNRRTEHGSHAIHLASQTGKLNIVNRLLELNTDINIVDLNHRTPLLKAVMYGELPIVQYLIEKRASIKKRDKDGNNALHLSAYYGHKQLTEFLIKIGVKVNIKNCNGLTPMDMAICNGYNDIVDVLYKVNEKNLKLTGTCRNYSSLHLAVESDKLTIVDYLLYRGGDVNFRNAKGYTLLHTASRKNHDKLVMFLLVCGADVNLKTHSKGFTALDFAAKNLSVNMINLLIQCGADFDIESNGHCRLLDLIFQNFSSNLETQQNILIAAQTVIKYIALRNRHIPSFFRQYDSPFLQILNKFWCKCQKQLEEMDKMYMANTNITQYRLLNSLFDDVQLAVYLSNEVVSEMCENLEFYIEFFPNYSNLTFLIDVGIKKAKIRKKLLSDADYIINKYLLNKLPAEIRVLITNYLEIDDLRNILTIFNIPVDTKKLQPVINIPFSCF